MRLLLVGDVMLGRLVNGFLATAPPQSVWGDTLPHFGAADLRFCNLECVITDDGTPWTQTPKVFRFRSDAKNVRALKAAGIDVVSLANNHTLDFGYSALFEMLTNLDHHSVLHAGAGLNLTQASRPAIVTVKGERVGFIAFTDNEPAWAATRLQPGVWYSPINLSDSRAQNVLQRVAKTKTQVDWLVVSVHWGPNWGYAPQPEHLTFARALIDYGADIVFGHSAHVFRGIELYHSRPILYSCGGFIDDYRVDEVERNDQSFIFTVDITDQGIQRLRLYPTVIHRCRAQLASPHTAQAIADKMKMLCHEVETPSRWNKVGMYLEIPVCPN